MDRAHRLWVPARLWVLHPSAASGGFKNHPGNGDERVRLKVLCLGRIWGGSRGGSPKEAAQAPLATALRWFPRSGFWQWPWQPGVVARLRDRVGTPGLGGGEGL